MPESGNRSRTPVGALALTWVFALLCGAADLRAEKRAAGTERWQGKEIEYEVSGKASSDVQFSRTGHECRINMVIDGRQRTVTLKGEDIDVDGEHLDVGSYTRVSLNAERDFLILDLVTVRSWEASASGSASSQRASGTSTATDETASRSGSSGTSTDHQAFGFTDLNGMQIRLRLKGGRSAKCSIKSALDQRVIGFDIDEGKNEGTIVIKPGLVSIGGESEEVDGAARVLVTATKSSLRITADEAEIWSRN